MPRGGGVTDGIQNPKLILRKAAVLHGFGNMSGIDRRATGKVGDTARHAQHPVVGSRGKPETADGLAQQIRPCGIRGAMHFNLARRQAGVDLSLPRLLPGTRSDHTQAHLGRRFAWRRRLQIFGRQRWHFELQIDPVQ